MIINPEEECTCGHDGCQNNTFKLIDNGNEVNASITCSDPECGCNHDLSAVVVYQSQAPE